MVLDDKVDGNEENFPGDVIPEGTFLGPTFQVDKRENHGFGYHAHVLIYKNGKFVRSGYMLTYDGSMFYASHHGKDKPLFRLDKFKSRLLKDIESDLSKLFAGIPYTELARPLRKSVPLYQGAI